MVLQLRKRMLTSMLRMAVASAALACATPVSAQTPEKVSAQPSEKVFAQAPEKVSAQASKENPRFFVSLNSGLQAGTRGFQDGGVYRDVLSNPAAPERWRFDSSYEFPVGTLLDVSGGVRITRHFGLGVGMSRFGVDHEGSVRVQEYPNFDPHRRDFRTWSDDPRQETALHFQALALLPAWRSLSVTLFGGPTLFNVSQHRVTAVGFTEGPSYSGVTFPTAFSQRWSDNTLGFNFGADVSHYFSDTVGVGWRIGYSRGTVRFRSEDPAGLDIQAGGLHLGGGLRLRF